jgi:hypothetical protein
MNVKVTIIDGKKTRIYRSAISMISGWPMNSFIACFTLISMPIAGKQLKIEIMIAFKLK